MRLAADRLRADHLQRARPRDRIADSFRSRWKRKIAVVCNRPFQRGALIQRVERAKLPAYAAEIDCASWPQLLLKFIVSHPAVACAIPATTRVDHVRENVAASYGRMPDEAMRPENRV
jgi:diketogulonate reductase-like aldo/keto reductase